MVFLKLYFENTNIERKNQQITNKHAKLLNMQRYRGSYMSAHVLLHLLNKLGKRGKMRGLLSILSLFGNKFNRFNNTRA